MRPINVVLFSSGISEQNGILDYVTETLKKEGYHCIYWRDLFAGAHDMDKGLWCLTPLTTIASRHKGVGCPICARKNNAVKIRKAAVIKHGSLKDSNPELLQEWDYAKNVEFEPDEVSSQSHELVWWLCSTCGNEWQAIIRNRVNGNSCPECIGAKKKPIKPKKVFVSLTDSNPQVALEWHPTRNGEVFPGDVSAGSHMKVWWKCKNGHEWQATPNHRTRIMVPDPIKKV